MKIAGGRYIRGITYAILTLFYKIDWLTQENAFANDLKPLLFS